ncbi:MAG TPA: hypothetical protein VJB87_05230 [Candidatus Nanoarchaeia archaeon]|nr:hypothetical protein [Candidatus Nanoarchaeia archaeon]
MTTRILYARGTRIIELPAGPVEEKDGLLVQQPAQTFITIVHGPRILECLGEHYWMNIPALIRKDRVCYKWLKEYYGTAKSYRDIQAGVSYRHYLGEEHRLPTAGIGRSFCGLVRFRDTATLSDMIKESIGELPLILPEGSTEHVLGISERQHLELYLSWPIYHIEEREDTTILRAILEHPTMWASTKQQELFKLLSSCSNTKQSRKPRAELVST